MTRVGKIAAVALGLLGLTTTALPDDVRSRQVVSLEVRPAAIVLDGGNRQQQLLITATDPAGRSFDVTYRAELAISNGTARVAGSRVVGVADGSAELTVRCGGQTAKVPIRVTTFDRFPPIHFENDLIPLFTKLGCNSGGCHGKASGQNGFKLSVFGFDPRADFQALVNEGRGRRLFLAEPERSLLVLKSTARVAHGGGRRMEPGSADDVLLTEWVRQGTPWGAEKTPRLAALRVEPAERVLDRNVEQQILATAIYSDGTRRDVTAAAAYTTNAPLVADVAQPGVLHTGGVPGEAAITVNYMGQVSVVEVQVPRGAGGSGATRPGSLFAVQNEIDPFVWTKLDKMGIVPSELADDATFLRRAFLDTIGTLPTAVEARAFLAENSADKRPRLIDKLLARDEFADYWALKWADILLVDRGKLGDRGAFEFHRWLRDNFARNRPYDEWVRELITATGNSGKSGPVNFYRAQRTPEELARSISQAFLGIRLDCAQCHHHPFERWGQDDFYGMAGYFNGLERKPLRGDPTRELVYHSGYRETKLPLTDAVIATRPPGGPVLESPQQADPRMHLAAWMTSPENPWFARLIANRLWKHFLGRGLIEPEDDLRSTNPATNEPLLAYLTRRVGFAHHRDAAAGGHSPPYDLKALMRLILNSRVYQLSSVTNETNADDRQNFSHYHVKRLPAEVLMDAISQVTGVPEEFPGMPQGTRAIELWDNRFPSYFLEIFGRPERNTPCECGRSNEPTLAQALHLMNAPEVETKLSHRDGRLAHLLATEIPRDKLIEELCLAAVNRPPTAKERKTAEPLFAQSPRPQAAEDFLWALLNSYDFLFVK